MRELVVTVVCFSDVVATCWGNLSQNRISELLEDEGSLWLEVLCGGRSRRLRGKGSFQESMQITRCVELLVFTQKHLITMQMTHDAN